MTESTVPTGAPRWALTAARPVSTVLFAVAAALAAATVLLAMFWPNATLRLELEPAGGLPATTTTLAGPAQAVGLIPAACATVDPVAFPCPAGNEVQL